MADTYTAPTAPRHLNVTGSRFWHEFCTDWGLEDTGDKELLRLACEALDRSTQARKLLRTEGLTYLDRFNAPHPHPAVNIELRSRTAAVNIVKQIQQARLTAERLEAAERKRLEVTPARRGGGGTRRHG
jgi:phage terminase small subunit